MSKGIKILEDDDLMPFGQHKGERMEDVPVRYLHYLWTHGMSSDKDSNVADYIRRNLSALKTEDDDLIWE